MSANILQQKDEVVRRTFISAVLLIILAWVFLAVYAVHAGLPYNPIRLPFEHQLQARVWIPEGWRFFTRNAREEDLFLLSFQEGGWRSVSMAPHSRASNGFGVNRMSRAQGIEAGLLIHRIPKSSWNDCSEDPIICLDKLTATRLKNTSPGPTLCGTIGFVMQKPIPWAWHSSKSSIIMPSRVLRLEAECD